MKLAEEGIFVIENCIPPSLQDKIEEYYFSESYRWPEKTGKYEDIITGKPITSLWSYAKLEEGFIINSTEFYFVNPILKSCLQQIEVDYVESDVILIKTIMQVPKKKSLRNNVHVDTDKKCYTVLYYVNDTDGDTVFLNKTTKDFSFEKYEKMRYEMGWYEKQKEIFNEEAFRITPQKGTAVIFDGSIYHAGSSPTKNKRCVVNFNYKWSSK